MKGIYRPYQVPVLSISRVRAKGPYLTLMWAKVDRVYTFEQMEDSARREKWQALCLQ